MTEEHVPRQLVEVATIRKRSLARGPDGTVKITRVWQEGDLQPTHRRAPRPKGHWQTREDPFSTSLPAIPTMLIMKGEQLARVNLT
jgi:hypothetical protein